ncbi:lachesin-like isoform X2 [Tribolium madens]|nr:lachesin-like isoform X2 [Tribolium madens]XP_044256648.1 lachesin-like isoform X2 [Tribolium madens]XP_044256649.1 lachesin-like isoform X2 [Tribolium madens]XP_044256650.1 lachesin-like isoform X2 [Tribolium madens]
MRVLNRQCARQLHNMTATQATFLFCTLLQAILTEGQMPEQPEPEFLAPLENHTVTQGRDIYFTCVVNHLSSYKVAWIKSDTKAILAIHTHMVAQNPRLSVTHNGHNTWMLHVSNVQKNDSGTYMCQINTDPMRSQMGNLEVVIPPDILNDNESTQGSGVAVEGGTITLRCYATGVPEPTVVWKREGGEKIILRHDGIREKQAMTTYHGETLTLTNVQRTDMGPYLCIASNGVPPSVSKRMIVKVHFHPLIRVSNQLVAAPIARDVLIQCYVEASPKAMNHWMRNTGEKLIPSEKYIIEEVPINEYSLLMNLTIRNLEKRDFGGYTCSSSNALGKAEGSVRLQERQVIIKSTSTASTPRYIETKPRKPPNKDKPKKYKQPKKKESGDSKSEEDHEMTTLLLPELKTQSPSQISVPSASRSPPWNHFHRNTAVGLPFETSCCYTFIGFVMFQLYTVYREIV